MLLLPPGAVALPECALVVPQQVSAWCRGSLGWTGCMGAFFSSQLSPAVAPQGPRGCFSFFHCGHEKENGKSKHSVT